MKSRFYHKFCLINAASNLRNKENYGNGRCLEIPIDCGQTLVSRIQLYNQNQILSYIMEIT